MRVSPLILCLALVGLGIAAFAPAPRVILLDDFSRPRQWEGQQLHDKYIHPSVHCEGLWSTPNDQGAQFTIVNGKGRFTFPNFDKFAYGHEGFALMDYFHANPYHRENGIPVPADSVIYLSFEIANPSNATAELRFTVLETMRYTFDASHQYTCMVEMGTEPPLLSIPARSQAKTYRLRLSHHPTPLPDKYRQVRYANRIRYLGFVPTTVPDTTKPGATPPPLTLLMDNLRLEIGQ